MGFQVPTVEAAGFPVPWPVYEVVVCRQGELFKALRKTKLIAPDAEYAKLQYSRCGRTDKGVSALGQVRTRVCLHWAR